MDDSARLFYKKSIRIHPLKIRLGHHYRTLFMGNLVWKTISESVMKE